MPAGSLTTVWMQESTLFQGNVWMNTVWKRLIVGSLRRVQILIGRANKKFMDPELEALGWSGVAKRRFSLQDLGWIIRLPYLLAESSRREINWFQIPKSILLLFLQQSWEQEILETKLLFHGTIFHFYKYCRKSNPQPQNQQFSVFNQVKTLQHSAYWAVFKLTAGGPKSSQPTGGYRCWSQGRR